MRREVPGSAGRVPAPDPRLGPSAQGDGRTRVLLAVVEGARTYSEVIERTGFARQTVHAHLHRLKALDLITWDDTPRTRTGARRQATMSPLVEVVAHG